jgi:hypothetical protein
MDLMILVVNTTIAVLVTGTLPSTPARRFLDTAGRLM